MRVRVRVRVRVRGRLRVRVRTLRTVSGTRHTVRHLISESRGGF